ncbi:TetR/AcrR family transcriptional regulator [Streptomyces sp. RFCAC02]|uniref:TetR/AcrR family transcriptional regulator n=1 Tax=Streptomyces sp. RFCAC02 TaxID=2499143 RepID=UPI00101F713E|nr:TetR/AcrR family transcriptional regulator [Streptomyces sp. RFCAC02]
MTTANTPRARYREQTRAEIKEVALRRLAEGGPEAVALTRIAKELGVSGPALYRYFDGRDALLSDLIRDAYDAFAEAVTAAEATAARAGDGPRARLRACGDAYRAWALAQPHRYQLIQGTPVPGYAAPADTRDRARAGMLPLLAVFGAADPAVPPDDRVLPLVAEMTAWVGNDAAVAEWVARAGLGADGRAGRALAGATLTWSAVHGTVSLEVSGHFSGMGHRPGTMLAAQLTELADTFRLPD